MITKIQLHYTLSFHQIFKIDWNKLHLKLEKAHILNCITTLLMESQHIGCKENEPKERLMGKIILGVIQRISA